MDGTHLRNLLLAGVLFIGLPMPGSALGIPVHGARLSLRASDAQPMKRSAKLLLRDPSIAAPLPDPRTGSGLILSGGVGPGQCRVELALDPTKWHVIAGDGPGRGYRYLDDSGASRGVRRIVLRPGAISLRAVGADWPCDLSDVQRMPVTVELRASGVRYCAAFGGLVDRNEGGRFHAHEAPAAVACPKTDLTVADLNILHGLFCPGRSAFCRLSERVDLLFQWIARVGCPDVVTLQEVSRQAAPVITTHLMTACPFPYERVYTQTSIGTDDEMILSRYPVVAHELRPLYPGFRSVRFVRIDHPIGPIDVFSTHLASSSDGAQNACTAPTCPLECIAAGATKVRECQGVQMAQFIAARHDVATPAVATGDFNESPDTFVYNQFVGRGWTDVYLAGGNPECDPATGIGCTSGRQDEVLAQLESPASNEVERIDFIFAVPPASGSLCAASIDSGGDADGDGTATRIFADDPNPFTPTCGPAPDAVCWPSDHEGMQLDLNCERAEQQ